MNKIKDDKYNKLRIKEIISIEDTADTIAVIESWHKYQGYKIRHLLFIDTSTGTSHLNDFSEKGYYEQVVPIKMEKFGIDKIVVLAQLVDRADKEPLESNDLRCIFIFSVDGKERVQLTSSNLFVEKWTCNAHTGTLVVHSYKGKMDKKKFVRTNSVDLGIYDLKTLQLIHQM